MAAIRHTIMLIRVACGLRSERCASPLCKGSSMSSILGISGDALINGQAVRGTQASFQAFDPALGVEVGPDFYTVDSSQIDQACRAAQAAFDPYRATSNAQRADFLEAIGAQILALGDALIVRAMAESGLPRARLEGERGRTVGQLKLFADLLRAGQWQDIRVDQALPERVPPRPELRLRMIGLGPVAVFGASNFPLAFSVAGGDTAAALAAGCPVVAKAHPAHPGTSELVARAIVQAVADCGLPAGVFSLLTGIGNALGAELVRHPAIQAVGFTGSRQGGVALMAIAAARPQPIPVYAEMSSINPVFLLPQALAARGEDIGKGFAASLTMGVGQFCTNPGLVLAIDGPGLDAFVKAASEALAGSQHAVMLNQNIADSYRKGVAHLASQDDVQAMLEPVASDTCKASPAVFRTTGAAFLASTTLAEEVFGPVTLLVECA